ncbi:MAG: hypothetical protein PQJ58_06710 [Spirochaetales bacterium]|nr:hypothetical protein [Spirochaetales bacterium]
MKYYRIDTAESVNGEVPPGIDGRNVKDKEKLFNRACGPDLFFEESPVFDYLVPLNFQEEDAEKEATMVCDYNYWWGEAPMGGWLTPVSEKLRVLLSNFNLGEHRFYDAWVLFKKEKQRHWILQFLSNTYESYINFDKTIFNNRNTSGKLGGRELQTGRFGSIEEVKAHARSNWGKGIYWNYERVVMKPEFRELDFIPFFKLGDLVSERLKAALEESGLTGFEFHELPLPVEFSDEVDH